MVCLDIWGGDAHTEHLARYILSIDEALGLARLEITAGYLVNLRQDATWGPEQNFDSRLKK